MLVKLIGPFWGWSLGKDRKEVKITDERINDQTSGMFQNSSKLSKNIYPFYQGWRASFSKRHSILPAPLSLIALFTMDASKEHTPAYSACRLQHVLPANSHDTRTKRWWQEQKSMSVPALPTARPKRCKMRFPVHWTALATEIWFLEKTYAATNGYFVVAMRAVA